MDAKTAISVEEYLRMSFDGADREYVDGDIVERAVGDKLHSILQARLIEIFYEIRRRHPLYALPELRHRVAATQYRIPDVSVFAGQKPTEDVPSSPPLVVVEIVSPDDRHTEVMQKLEEYLAWGVPNIWLIDPRLRQFAVYDSSGLREVPALKLPEFNVEIPAAEIFESL